MLFVICLTGETISFQDTQPGRKGRGAVILCFLGTSLRGHAGGLLTYSPFSVQLLHLWIHNSNVCQGHATSGVLS